MDDMVLVGVMNGRADGMEELESRIRGQFVPVAVRVDRQALDIIHDEVGKTILGCAAVEQLRVSELYLSVKTSSAVSHARPPSTRRLPRKILCHWRGASQSGSVKPVRSNLMACRGGPVCP